MTIPYKKRDPLTELWLCNPALGLGKPERVPEQPEDSPEPPVKGLITGPSSRQVPSFGALLRAPRSSLSAIVAWNRRNYKFRLFHSHISAKPAAWSLAILFQNSDVVALSLKFNIMYFNGLS